jgi:hypothetical protein
MFENITESFLNWDMGQWLGFVTSPSFRTVQLALVIYGGLLWLSIIVWVTRDAISRSNSLLFQVFAILLNIGFPVLGILLYLIVRPGKTVLERYYEELEHRLILESIQGKGHEAVSDNHPLKLLRRKVAKKGAKETAEPEEGKTL